MRSFIISICLFAMLITGIILNCYYVNSVHGEMSAIIREIKIEPCDENEDLIKELLNLWESKSSMLSISVGYKELNEISDAIASLNAANLYGDKLQICIALEYLTSAIDEITRLEKLNINNVM